MSTIHDLRATLDRQAATVHDTVRHTGGVTATDRVSAVRGRARVVRRRRAAGGALAVALVVGVVATVPILGGGGQDLPVVDRQLGGLEAPPSLTSLGATYDFAAGEADQGRVSLEVPASDLPQLVTWASDAEPGTMTVGALEEGAVDRDAASGDFTDFSVVDPRPEPLTITASGDGEVALAVYELDGQPSGQSVDGFTWRDQVGSWRRLDSAVGPSPAEAIEVSGAISGDRRVEVRDFCAAEDAGWTAVVVTQGKLVSYGECSVDQGRGEAPGNAASVPFDPAVSGRVSAQTWLVRTEDARTLGSRPGVEDLPRVADAPGVTLGVALYEAETAPLRVAGWAADRVIEHDGHLWRATEVVPGGRSGSAVRTTLRPDGAPVLASALSTTRLSSRVQVLGAGQVVLQMQGGGASDAVVVTDEEAVEVEVRVRRGGSPGDRLGIVVYERVD